MQSFIGWYTLVPSVLIGHVAQHHQDLLEMWTLKPHPTLMYQNPSFHKILGDSW